MNHRRISGGLPVEERRSPAGVSTAPRFRRRAGAWRHRQGGAAAAHAACIHTRWCVEAVRHDCRQIAAASINERMRYESHSGPKWTWPPQKNTNRFYLASVEVPPARIGMQRKEDPLENMLGVSTARPLKDVSSFTGDGQFHISLWSAGSHSPLP